MLRLGAAFGFSPESGKIMSYPAVIPFYHAGLRFWFDMLFFRHQFSVALPVITEKGLEASVFFILSHNFLKVEAPLLPQAKSKNFFLFCQRRSSPNSGFFSRHGSVSRPVRPLQENLKSLEIPWIRQISWSNNKLSQSWCSAPGLSPRYPFLADKAAMLSALNPEAFRLNVALR